jgi:hypothetical protein
VPAFRRHVFTARDLPALVSLLRGAGARHTYFAISPTQVHFVRLYGILPHGSLTNLLRLLRSSPDFRLAYRHGHAFVFELTARPARSRPASTKA